MEGDKLTTTYSMWNTFRNCRRQCQHRYVDKLRPLGAKAESLQTGDLVHRCLEKWYRTNDAVLVQELIDSELFGMTDEFGAMDAAKCRWQVTTAMMSAYTSYYPTEDFQVMELELPFTSEIYNPATGAVSRSFTIAGKVDGVIQTPDGIFILEHKTASRIDAGYIDRLSSDMQVQLYSHFVEQAYGWKITGVLYNILGKPASTMKQKGGETDAEFAERIATAKAPGRCKQQMAETEQEFMERLLDWYQESPQERFHRETLYFTPRDIEDLRSELWELTQQYLSAQRSEDRRGFYKNSSQCYNYNRACDYVTICRAANPDAIINAFYTRGNDMHPELSTTNTSDELF